MSEPRVFATDQVYHLYNRGVAKQEIFHDDQDFTHLLNTLSFYREAHPERRFSLIKPDERRRILSTQVECPLIEILGYCLMPNHFHLIVRQLVDGGITTFLRRALNSYARAYNTRYRRVGTIFQGRCGAVLIESNEQLLHVTRYAHLNPVVAKLVKTAEKYRWSSYPQYLSGQVTRLCSPTMVLELAGGSEQYRQFTEDYVGYAQDLATLKHLLHDVED